MKKAEELRRQLDALREEIRVLSEKTELTDDEEKRLGAALDEFKPLEEQTVAAERRAAQVEQVRASAARSWDGHDGAPQQIRRVDPFADDTRASTRTELRDRAHAAVEQRGQHLNDRQRAGLDRLLRTSTPDTDGSVIAERLLLTENDAYRSAFAKAMTRQAPAFTGEEADAVERFFAFERKHELRAANEGTGSAGGFGIPVLIDPTIIISSGAADAPLLELATVKQITTNIWKGITAPGAVWQFQAESAVVPDNTAALVQPSITVYRADSFIPYTIELEQDYPGFQAEMQKLLEQGYIDLLALKTVQGSGVNEPFGLLTRMANTTTNPAHTTVTTAGTLAAADVRKVWGNLPEKFRQRSTTRWLTSISVENLIRAFGNNNALADFTVNLAADGTSVLMGKPMILTDYVPAFTGQTNTFSYAVVGDLSQYYVIQRAGMSVELVQHLFDPATGRPIGQRGWFANARLGADAVNPNAFRVLTNN